MIRGVAAAVLCVLLLGSTVTAHIQIGDGDVDDYNMKRMQEAQEMNHGVGLNLDIFGVTRFHQNLIGR